MFFSENIPSALWSTIIKRFCLAHSAHSMFWPSPAWSTWNMCCDALLLGPSVGIPRYDCKVPTTHIADPNSVYVSRPNRALSTACPDVFFLRPSFGFVGVSRWRTPQVRGAFLISFVSRSPLLMNIGDFPNGCHTSLLCYISAPVIEWFTVTRE